MRILFRLKFIFFALLFNSCSDGSSECVNCSAVTTSDESIQCGISNQFDAVSSTDLGLICTNEEIQVLVDQYDQSEFPIYSAMCGGEPYTRKTRVVCN